MKELLLLLLILPGFLFGQQKKKEKNRWSTIASIGLAAGESDTQPVFQLTGGLNYHHFFTGIGIGYDTYEFKSIPVFADWRLNFGKKQIGFIYGNAGYNFPGNYKAEPESMKTADNLKGGLFIDLGVGCRIPLGAFNRLSLSAGYSRKNMNQIKTYVFPCITGDCPRDVHELKYNFGRFIAKMSWELGY